MSSTERSASVIDGVTAAPGGVPVRGRRNAVRSKRVKSEVTRERLLRAAAELIERTPLRAIKVSDITSRATVAPSTFYIYFADVEEAVLALLEQAHAAMPDLPARARAIAQDRLECSVRALVTDYLAFWEAHHALLRIRNLAADEGEERFRASRARMLGPFLRELADRIAALRAGDLDARHAPLAIAAVILGSMERLAAYIRVNRPGVSDLSSTRLFDAEVFLICQLLGGRQPAADGVLANETDNGR